MRNALKSLKRIRLMALLIILQLSIGLSMLNSVTMIYQENTEKLNTFKGLFNFENTYLVTLHDSLPKGKLGKSDVSGQDGLSKQIMYANKYNEFIEVLKNEGKIKTNSFYFSAGDPPIQELDKYLPQKYKNLAGINKARLTAKININSDFLKCYQLKIRSGRNFTDEDFKIDYKKDNIPIIVGLDFMPNVKVGDVFSDKVKRIVENSEIKTESDKKSLDANQLVLADVKYEVIGIMEHNAIPSIVTKENLIENLTYSDSFQIIPTVEELDYINEGTILLSGGSYIEVLEPSVIDYIKSETESDMEENNLEFKTKPLKEEARKIQETLIRGVTSSLALGTTLTLLSIIGITSIITGELSKRKKEFGIRISSGATLKILTKEIIQEIFIMITISCILSVLSSLIKNYIFYSSASLSISFLGINILIIGVLTIIISILPIVKIRKMNVIDLIRGK